jgi:hypothetical protein
MKRIIYFIAIILIASCNKNDSEPNSSPGFLAGYLNNDPEIVVSQTSETNISPSVQNFGIYRGYNIIFF